MMSRRGEERWGEGRKEKERRGYLKTFEAIDSKEKNTASAKHIAGSDLFTRM